MDEISLHQRKLKEMEGIAKTKVDKEKLKDLNESIGVLQNDAVVRLARLEHFESRCSQFESMTRELTMIIEEISLESKTNVNLLSFDEAWCEINKRKV